MEGDDIVIRWILAEIGCHVEKGGQLGEAEGKKEKVKGEAVLVFVKGYQSLLVVGVG